MQLSEIKKNFSSRSAARAWASRGRAFLGKPSRREVILLNSLAVVVGILSGYFAIGFRALIGLFQNLFLHHQISFDLISPSGHVLGPWIILAPPIGFLVVAYLVRWFAPEAKGHGVPEVIEAVLTRGGRIRSRVVALKALASSLTIAVGGSVGREGPIVQIGSATGSTLGQIFNMRPNLIRVLVGCGAAGAVGATFNTPIAGVIFAIEAIILEFKTKSFIPLVISSVFATVISRIHLGNHPAFVVPEHSFVNPEELILYLGLGVVSGLVGVVVVKTLYAIEDLFDHAKIPFFTKPIIGGLILGIIGYFRPEALGVGYETMEAVLQQESEFFLMASLVGIKIIAMSITLAAGGSGGVFAPSLFIGAMLGGAYGWVANQYFPELTAGYGAYALVGMAAVFAATSRAAFTAIVILIEMTLDYSIILPLMFVCVVSDQVAWALSKHSIYSLKLIRKGISFNTDIGLNVMAVTRIRDIMTTELTILPETLNLKEAKSIMASSPHTLYPVVDKSGKIIGQIRRSNILNRIKRLGPDANVTDLMRPIHSEAYPDEFVIATLNRLERNNTRDPRIWITDRQTKRLCGIVAPTDLCRLISKDPD